MKRLSFLLFFMLLICSCVNNFSEEDIIGTYTPIGYKNCYDTIQIKKTGIYHRKVYDKKKKLLLEMDGKWSFSNGDKGTIQFKSFFLNLDRDLTRYPELVQDTLGGGAFLLDNKNGRIEFCTGYFSATLSNQNCFQKQF